MTNETWLKALRPLEQSRYHNLCLLTSPCIIKAMEKAAMGIQEDNNLIRLIANRASQFYCIHGIDIKPEYIASELKTCHEEICPLRLAGLLDADIKNLMHDISGIHRYMDILNGSFWECWRPRFAK